MIKQVDRRNLSDNHRSAIFMMLAMVGYVLNDTMTKLVSAEFSVFQVIFMRGIILSLFIGLMVWQQGESLNPFANGDLMLWLRVSAEIVLAFFFLTGLFNMPLANMTAIMQLAPLLLTLVLALFFGEKVGWRRYTAIFIGFIGILIIVRPGTDGFNIYSLFALAAVSLLIVRDLATQRVRANISSLKLVYVTTILSTFINGLITLSTGWQAVSLTSILILAAAAVFVFVGYLFSVLTMRVGEASYTATFRYTGLVWAILISVLVFKDIPDVWTLLGCAIVAGAGLYALNRERTK